jgi:hypothetical protein
LVSIPRNAKTRPACTYQKARDSGAGEEWIERHLRGDVIGRADDQSEPEGTDDLAEITNAVTEAYATGAKPAWPYLSQVRPDDRVAGIAEEALDHNQHEEYRHGAEVDVVPITARAMLIAPPIPIRKPDKRRPRASDTHDAMRCPKMPRKIIR